MEADANVAVAERECTLTFQSFIHERAPVNDITGTDAALYFSPTSSCQPLNIDGTEAMDGNLSQCRTEVELANTGSAHLGLTPEGLRSSQKLLLLLLLLEPYLDSGHLQDHDGSQ